MQMMTNSFYCWGVLSLSCDCGLPLPPYPQIVAAMWLWSSPAPLPSNCRYHMTVVIPFSSVPHSKKLSTIHTCCTFGLTLKSINPLTTDDAFWRHQILAACYQIAQFILKIGSVLAERVGQGEVGGSTALPDRAWWQLQLPVESLGQCWVGHLFAFLHKRV